MKHSPGRDVFRSPGFVAGVAAPWLFLIAGAVLSLLDLSAYLDKTAAYLVVIGLAIMATAFLFSHLRSGMTVRHRH
jgi:hypothetical protein